jgi:hypothetical protein
MKTTTLAAAVLVLAVAAPGRPQEPAPRREEEEPERPKRMIRVLQSPYDLASFYSSRPGRSGVTPPVPHDPAYALASFYRSRGGGGVQGSPAGPWLWAAFWARGYSAHRPMPFVGYRRSIGENGDLFLAVPFLAPLGPLGGGFPGHHSPGHSPGRSPGHVPRP